MKNWKTTLAAVIVALIGAAAAMEYITPDVAGAITTIAVSIGLIAAKDSDVTGGTKQQ